MSTKFAPEFYLSPHFAGIPDELKSLRQWVVWKFEPRADGKLTKPPYNPHTGQRARTHDQEGKTYTDRPEDTWGTFEDAQRAYCEGGYDGIGFVFTEADPYAGFDSDDCVDEAGAIDPEAEEYADLLHSYTEYSPTGTGYKVICKAKKPGDPCRTGNYEFYDRARFFTLTGRRVPGTPATINDAQEGYTAAYRRIFAPKAKPEQSGETQREKTAAPGATRRKKPDAWTEEQVIEAIRRSDQGAKFARLFDQGDYSDYVNSKTGKPDHSRGDAGLCAIIAGYTKDAGQIDRLFRRSAMVREKWERANYREPTIAYALSIAWQYDPNYKSALGGEDEEEEADSAAPEEEPPTAEDGPGKSLHAILRDMERRMRRLKITPYAAGLFFPEGIDRQDVESIGDSLQFGTDRVQVLLNFLWGDWYNAMPRGARAKWFRDHYPHNVYPFKADREMDKVRGYATICTRVPKEIRLLVLNRSWNFIENLSAFWRDPERMRHWAEKKYYAGIYDDMYKDRNPGEGQTPPPPANDNRTPESSPSVPLQERPGASGCPSPSPPSVSNQRWGETASNLPNENTKQVVNEATGEYFLLDADRLAFLQSLDADTLAFLQSQREKAEAAGVTLGVYLRGKMDTGETPETAQNVETVSTSKQVDEPVEKTGGIPPVFVETTAVNDTVLNGEEYAPPDPPEAPPGKTWKRCVRCQRAEALGTVQSPYTCWECYRVLERESAAYFSAPPVAPAAEYATGGGQ